MDFLWFGSLLLMRCWVWNAYIIIMVYSRAPLHSGAFSKKNALHISTVNYTFNLQDGYYFINIRWIYVVVWPDDISLLFYISLFQIAQYIISYAKHFPYLISASSFQENVFIIITTLFCNLVIYCLLITWLVNSSIWRESSIKSSFSPIKWILHSSLSMHVLHFMLSVFSSAIHAK